MLIRVYENDGDSYDLEPTNASVADAFEAAKLLFPAWERIEIVVTNAKLVRNKP